MKTAIQRNDRGALARAGNRPTVLIVDEDLRFAFWLGRLLNGVGYTALPARNGADGAALLHDLDLRLDLLVINPYSRGVAYFIENLRRRTFKAIAVQMWDGAAALLAGVDEALVKPQPGDKLSELEWMGAVERVLAK